MNKFENQGFGKIVYPSENNQQLALCDAECQKLHFMPGIAGNLVILNLSKTEMYALLANVIVAREGATFNDLPHFTGGIVHGDGIITTWSYRAGAGRAEEFLLKPEPLTASTAYDWGVVTEIAPNGKALSWARELASHYLKAPEVTLRNTLVHSSNH